MIYYKGKLSQYATIQIGKLQKKTRRMDFGKENQPLEELNMQPDDLQENTKINLHENSHARIYKQTPAYTYSNLCPA